MEVVSSVDLNRKAEPNATSPSFQLRRRPSSHRWPVTMYFLYKRMSTYVSQYVRTCVLPHSQVVVSQVFYPKSGRCHKQDRTPFISGVRFRHSLYEVYIRKSCGVGVGCVQWLVQYVYCCLVDTRMARCLITRQRGLLPLEAQSHESEMDVSKLRISKQPMMCSGTVEQCLVRRISMYGCPRQSITNTTIQQNILKPARDTLVPAI